MPDSAATKIAAAELAASRDALLTGVATLPCANGHTLDTCPVERLRLELGTHQAELEAQNQELRESNQTIEEARDRYGDLYDFAPIGYLTLDRQGIVQEINLTACNQLGIGRTSILGKPLLLWLSRSSHTAFHEHLLQCFKSPTQVTEELVLKSQDGSLHYISLTSVAQTRGAQAGIACRSAMTDITTLKEKEVALTESRQQLRDLSAHLDQIREDERKHLAREIHDELGQKLTALRFEMSMFWTRQPSLSPSATLSTMLKQIDEAIASVRAIAADLRPAVLDLGLPEAVEWLVQDFRQRTGIHCDFTATGMEFCLDNARATAIFRIIQESLTNIVRHAAASQVEVTLYQHGNGLEVDIRDNGVGMKEDALTKPKSFGIAGIRERVRLLGGRTTIQSHPGRGTELHASFPLNERRTIGRPNHAMTEQGNP